MDRNGYREGVNRHSDPYDLYTGDRDDYGVGRSSSIIAGHKLSLDSDTGSKVLQNPINRLRQNTRGTPKSANTTESSSAVTVSPKDHPNSEGHWNGNLEKQIMKDIQDKPINLIGEPTLISNCPHDCNNQGLCQRIFVKVKKSENPDTYSYEPHYSCACKENFKGEHCQE